jgi:preprotein translocase subunit Sec63
MEAIEAAFGPGQSLYEIMGVQTTATEAQIKKAYFKLALTCVSALDPKQKQSVSFTEVIVSHIMLLLAYGTSIAHATAP